MSRAFRWFGEKSVAALTERLVAAGPGARLEVRTKDGSELPSLYLRVVAKDAVKATDGDDPPDVNDSFACPPVCPE